ncbi:MAG: aminotransferase class V-fold PLP-dependent enzyme [Candidatus Omnitrophica bacterium]|nr:aminotransferase class V-fold PLP-dependent enzyme [Candidatus Omnitrophota bacterium]
MNKIELDSATIGPNAISYVNHILSGLIKGQQVNLRITFEKKVGEYLGTKYAYACNSGTNALHIALLALNLTEGSEVITNPLTNIATISAILKTRCKPVFPLLKRDGFFDIEDLEKKITRKTKAVIPVHFSGYAEDLNKLTGIARKHDLFIIEDACQAFGSMLKIKGEWRSLGSIGDMGVYSFGGGKILSTIEGGMIATNDPSIAQRVGKLVGIGDYSKTITALGFNSRLDALRSAVGLANFNDLNRNIESRKKIWLKYQRSLLKYPWVDIIPIKDSLRINYSSFVLKIGSRRTRERLLSLLRGINYHMSDKRQKGQPNAYIDSCFLDKRIIETMDSIYESYVFLPVHGNMETESIENIISCFHQLDRIGLKGRLK